MIKGDLLQIPKKLLHKFQVNEIDEVVITGMGTCHTAAVAIAAIMNNHPAIKEFTDNPIYKKANKYFMSGQAKKDHDFSKKIMPKNMHNSEIMDNAPPNLLLANKIFELTFVNKLNKFFKYD